MSQYNATLVQDMKQQGPAATRELNDKLYPLVAAGDPDARRQMLEGNMSLVISKVESYLSVYPDAAYLRDDLVGEGNLGLCTAVSKMVEEGPVESPNPTGYMSYWVMKMIGQIVERETTCVPGTSARRARQVGKHVPKYVPLILGDENEEGDEDGKEENTPTLASSGLKEIDPRTMVDLHDLIDACCETPEDKVIVDMREKGYVDKEIAQTLNLPHTTVYMMRREIYRRFLEKSDVNGEV